jgi:hypothetical protein
MRQKLGSTAHSFFSIFKSLDSKEESMQRRRAVQGSSPYPKRRHFFAKR